MFIRSRRSGVRRRRFRRSKRVFRRGRSRFRRSSIRRFSRAQGRGRLRHSFKSGWSGSLDFTGGTTTSTYITGSSFAISQLTNWSAMLSLFDDYRINGLRIRWFSPWTEALPTSAYVLRLHSVIDRDDITPPASVDAFRAYPSYRCVELTRARGGSYARFWKPNVLNLVASNASGTVIARSHMRPPVLDATDNAVAHYGVKWALELVGFGVGPTDPMPMGLNFKLRYDITYYVTMSGAPN